MIPESVTDRDVYALMLVTSRDWRCHVPFFYDGNNLFWSEFVQFFKMLIIHFDRNFIISESVLLQELTTRTFCRDVSCYAIFVPLISDIYATMMTNAVLLDVSSLQVYNTIPLCLCWLFGQFFMLRNYKYNIYKLDWLQQCKYYLQMLFADSQHACEDSNVTFTLITFEFALSLANTTLDKMTNTFRKQSKLLQSQVFSWWQETGLWCICLCSISVGREEILFIHVWTSFWKLLSSSQWLSFGNHLWHRLVLRWSLHHVCLQWLHSSNMVCRERKTFFSSAASSMLHLLVQVLSTERVSIFNLHRSLWWYHSFVVTSQMLGKPSWTFQGSWTFEGNRRLSRTSPQSVLQSIPNDVSSISNQSQQQQQ